MNVKSTIDEDMNREKKVKVRELEIESEAHCRRGEKSTAHWLYFYRVHA